MMCAWLTVHTTRADVAVFPTKFTARRAGREGAR
jgi:hypothetical protein